MEQRMKASEAVGQSPELLEMILMELPMRDLLMAQKICRLWRSLIKTSLHLRRALFLEPAACGTVSYIDWRLDDKNVYGDCDADINLGEPLRGKDGTKPLKRYISHWGKIRTDAGAYRVFVNPLLAEQFAILSADGIYDQEKVGDLSPAMRYESASWKQMLFTQPAINCLAIEWDSEGTEESGAWTISACSMAWGTKGYVMSHLFWKLGFINRPAWIEGRDQWEEWTGADDLGRIKVAR